MKERHTVASVVAGAGINIAVSVATGKVSLGIAAQLAVSVFIFMCLGIINAIEKGKQQP